MEDLRLGRVGDAPRARFIAITRVERGIPQRALRGLAATKDCVPVPEAVSLGLKVRCGQARSSIDIERTETDADAMEMVAWLDQAG